MLFCGSTTAPVVSRMRVHDSPLRLMTSPLTAIAAAARRLPAPLLLQLVTVRVTAWAWGACADSRSASGNDNATEVRKSEAWDMAGVSWGGPGVNACIGSRTDTDSRAFPVNTRIGYQWRAKAESVRRAR